MWCDSIKTRYLVVHVEFHCVSPLRSCEMKKGTRVTINKKHKDKYVGDGSGGDVNEAFIAFEVCKIIYSIEF